MLKEIELFCLEFLFDQLQMEAFYVYDARGRIKGGESLDKNKNQENIIV